MYLLLGTYHYLCNNQTKSVSVGKTCNSSPRLHRKKITTAQPHAGSEKAWIDDVIEDARKRMLPIGKPKHKIEKVDAL